MSKVPINTPIMDDEEVEAVQKIVSEHYFTDQSYEGGKYVREFETALESYLNVKHVVAVS